MLRITIPLEHRSILHRSLIKAGSRECGGILLGEHVGTNHFAVRGLTTQKPGAIASFVRSMTNVVTTIKAFCGARGNDFAKFNYLGEWHSHPLFTVQPSAQDHATMRALAMDPKVGANFVVLLVFRLRGTRLEGSAHTYLPDGTVHPAQLELEGTA
jgi:hypothetical protein